MSFWNTCILAYCRLGIAGLSPKAPGTAGSALAALLAPLLFLPLPLWGRLLFLAVIVVTGGLAKYVTPLCRHPLTYDPELLMKGLALLYQMNAPQHHAGGGKKRNQNFRRARRPHPQRRERHEDEAKAG